MANNKIAYLDLGTTGLALSVDVRRLVDSFWCDDADGVFRAVPADNNLTVTEPINYRYYFVENRTAWNTGQYLIRFKVTATQIPIGSMLIEIDDADAIITLNTLDDEIDDVLVDTNEMQGKLPTNNIMGSGVKSDKDDEIDAILLAVVGITGGPVVRIDVPEKLIRPTAGATIYRIVVNLYNSIGAPLAPDSDPIIKITNRDETIVRVPDTAMSGVSVGQYFYDYTITSASPLEKETVKITVVENLITSYHREVTELYEEGESSSGTGAVVVDHDYGAVDNYRILRISTGAPIEGVGIYAFTQADWNAGNRDTRSVHDGGNCRGYAQTGSDGRWLKPMMLDPDTYVLYISDPEGEYQDSPVTVVVT